jgi:hypothetical protein
MSKIAECCHNISILNLPTLTNCDVSFGDIFCATYAFVGNNPMYYENGKIISTQVKNSNDDDIYLNSNNSYFDNFIDDNNNELTESYGEKKMKIKKKLIEIVDEDNIAIQISSDDNAKNSKIVVNITYCDNDINQNKIESSNSIGLPSNSFDIELHDNAEKNVHNTSTIITIFRRNRIKESCCLVQ